MPPAFTGAVRDSLSNLAASLGAGKDKAASDSFVLFDLDRGQIEAMVRGDWLARKVVDIVPYDSVREWRAWSGHRADVARVEAAERRLGLRKAVQRAMVLGRLYGGGAILIGTGETDPAALARPLDPDTLPRGGLRFLHAVSRWQLSAPAIDRDPLSPWFGEALFYEVVAPERGALRLHPSRVVRFLGNPYPDPSLVASVWSDSVLQALYDAIHAVALTTAGATSLMHEAKVDVVTVPNLSEHLSSSDTTAQLSARFAYAASMKSINNLLLLGDGETWSRQRVDFAGLPEMVRTFLQVAAGAADIPVTRLLGQSPAGLSATGDSDTRNYYDMIAARQALDLRPQLERLDRLILASEGIAPDALSFAFRPLWQMDAATAATVALTKAQATQIYADLGLWPTAVTARLVEAQVIADGTYPNAAAVFAEAGAASVEDASTGDAFPAGLGLLHYRTEPREEGSSGEEEPRDWHGRWTTGAGGGGSPDAFLTRAGFHPEERRRRRAERRRERARRREREGEATSHPGDPEEEGEPHHVERLRHSPTAPADEPQASAPSTSNSPSLAHSPPGELDPHSLDPYHGVPPDLREELKLRPSPPGITFNVSGNNTTELGNSYSEQVRDRMQGDLPPKPAGPGSSVPDGLILGNTPGGKIAIEAKYVDDWSESIYNPNLRRVFAHNAIEDIIAQAMRYSEAYSGGVEWVTNSLDFVKIYGKLFSAAGIRNYHFTIIPAVRR